MVCMQLPSLRFRRPDVASTSAEMSGREDERLLSSASQTTPTHQQMQGSTHTHEVPPQSPSPHDPVLSVSAAESVSGSESDSELEGWLGDTVRDYHGQVAEDLLDSGQEESDEEEREVECESRAIVDPRAGVESTSGHVQLSRASHVEVATRGVFESRSRADPTGEFKIRQGVTVQETTVQEHTGQQQGSFAFGDQSYALSGTLAGVEGFGADISVSRAQTTLHRFDTIDRQTATTESRLTTGGAYRSQTSTSNIGQAWGSRFSRRQTDSRSSHYGEDKADLLKPIKWDVNDPLQRLTRGDAARHGEIKHVVQPRVRRYDSALEDRDPVTEHAQLYKSSTPPPLERPSSDRDPSTSKLPWTAFTSHTMPIALTGLARAIEISSLEAVTKAIKSVAQGHGKSAKSFLETLSEEDALQILRKLGESKGARLGERSRVSAPQTHSESRSPRSPGLGRTIIDPTVRVAESTIDESGEESRAPQKSEMPDRTWRLFKFGRGPGIPGGDVSTSVQQTTTTAPRPRTDVHAAPKDVVPPTPPQQQGSLTTALNKMSVCLPLMTTLDFGGAWELTNINDFNHPNGFNSVPIRRCLLPNMRNDPCAQLPPITIRAVRNLKVGESVRLLRQQQNGRPLLLQCNCGHIECEYRIVCACEVQNCPWPFEIHTDQFPPIRCSCSQLDRHEVSRV